MSGDFRRRAAVRGLALAIGCLSLVVVAVSAYLRLDAAGIGCADWPACYAQVLAGDPAPLHYGFARVLHRLAASAALVLACVLVWRCLRPQPLLPAARYAVLLLALMLALSALGFFSADPRRVLVGFLNIVGGLGLVTFSWRTALAAAPLSTFGSAPRSDDGRLLLTLGSVALTAAVVLGAWLGASYAAAACVSLPACGGTWWPAAEGWAALNPLARPSAAPLPGDAGGVTLHLLHRALAVASVLILAAAALSMWRRPEKRAAAGALLLLLLGVFALGLAAIASGLSLWLIVAHGVAAALLLAALATLRRRQG